MDPAALCVSITGLLQPHDRLVMQENGTISVPGVLGDQQLVVTSTGLNNQTSIIGQDAQERLEGVSCFCPSHPCFSMLPGSLLMELRVMLSIAVICCPTGHMPWKS